MSSRFLFAGMIAATTAFAGTCLTGFAGQSAAAQMTGGERVPPFARPSTKRLPSDGSTKSDCPETMELGKLFRAFALSFRKNHGIPIRDQELMILRTGWLVRDRVMWGSHVVRMKDNDITDDDIQRIIEGPAAKGWSEWDSA